VHVEACSNEASAAAMLGASIHYPLRGAVTWKSIVGTNVAADALSNLSSPGVRGGALIVVGEDYGEGASVIQERTHAYALKSTLLLLDPRPELGHMVRLVEHAFAMSEASNMPAVMELRIRACHVRGRFECKDNVAPAVSTRHLIAEPAGFDYMRLAHPPVTFRHEKLKIEQRIPAAQRYIVEHGLNEHVEGARFADVGLVVQGGLYNALMRALQQLGLADAFGASEVDLEVVLHQGRAVEHLAADQRFEAHGIALLGRGAGAGGQAVAVGEDDRVAGEARHLGRAAAAGDEDKDENDEGAAHHSSFPGTTAASRVGAGGPARSPSLGVARQRQRSPVRSRRPGTSSAVGAKPCCCPLRVQA